MINDWIMISTNIVKVTLLNICRCVWQGQVERRQISDHALLVRFSTHEQVFGFQNGSNTQVSVGKCERQLEVRVGVIWVNVVQVHNLWVEPIGRIKFVQTLKNRNVAWTFVRNIFRLFLRILIVIGKISIS